MPISKEEINNIFTNNISINKQQIPKIILDILKLKNLSEIIINEDRDIAIESGSKFFILNKKASPQEVEKLIDFISYYNNKSIGFNKPIFDGVLPKGIRVNVISPPVSHKSYIITLRIKNSEKINLDYLLKQNSINESLLEEIKTIIAEKQNILIAGGTSTGKTTFVNALLEILPKNERLVILEDTPEIEFENPFVSKLKTAQHLDAELKIKLGDLVKTSLRMRPDRIIVGEIRGKEAYDLLHAMNTGHKGLISTIHANSARDALRRLEVLSILGQKNLDIFVPRSWIKNNINIIIYMEKIKNKRIIKELVKLEGMEGETYILKKIF